MKRMISLLTLLVLAFTVACGGPNVEVKADWDKTNKSTFKTFAFQPVLGLEGADFKPELGVLVREGAKAHMIKRGYTYVEPTASPDLVFDFHLAVKSIKEEKTTQVAKPRSAGVGGAIADYNTPSGEFTERKEIIEYDEGTVRAEAIDVKGNKLFWECIVIGELKDRDPAKRKARVEGVLDLVFEKWGFKPGA